MVPEPVLACQFVTAGPSLPSLDVCGNNEHNPKRKPLVNGKETILRQFSPINAEGAEGVGLADAEQIVDYDHIRGGTDIQ